MLDRLAVAAGLGAVTGLRTFTGMAVAARELSRRQRPWRKGGRPPWRSAGRLEAWLADDRAAAVLGALALGELAMDKMPAIPDRVEAGSLAGRAVVGGLLGALATTGGRSEHAVLLGAMAGAAGAVAGAWAGWFLRREAGRATVLPGIAIALAEDAVAAARELVREL